jgi:hypothetical protein
MVFCDFFELTSQPVDSMPWLILMILMSSDSITCEQLISKLILTRSWNWTKNWKKLEWKLEWERKMAIEAARMMAAFEAWLKDLRAGIDKELEWKLELELKLAIEGARMHASLPWQLQISLKSMKTRLNANDTSPPPSSSLTSSTAPPSTSYWDSSSWCSPGLPLRRNKNLCTLATRFSTAHRMKLD